MSFILALYPVAPEIQADGQLSLDFLPLGLFCGFVAALEQYVRIHQPVFSCTVQMLRW